MTSAARGGVRDVTSPANPDIKAIRSLHLKKYRDRDNLFIAEGLKHVLDALAAGWLPRILVVARLDQDESTEPHRRDRAIETVLENGGKVLSVPSALLGKITKRDNPQSVVGVFEKRFASFEVIGKGGLWIALDRIRDPGNLGTIIRTADAAACEGIILVDQCCDPFSVETVRASMGSLFHVPIAQTVSDVLVNQVRKLGVPLIGTHLAAATTDFKDADYHNEVIILMGNEQQGLSDELAAKCDQLVRIPMRKGADSLNLAVSTSLMIYEALRQRT